MTISSSNPTQRLLASDSSLCLSISLTMPSLSSSLDSGRILTLLSDNRVSFVIFLFELGVDLDAESPPSSSHTRNSLPRVLTLTALPRGVISAEDTEEV